MNRYSSRIQPHAAERCSICGASLVDGYYYLADRPERYCSRCIAERPRCDACSAPVGDDYWRLHDGRVLCATCHATAIYDPVAATQLYDETVAAIAGQLGLTLRVGVAFRLVDAPTLAAVRAQGGASHPDEKTLGLYVRQGTLRVIYLLFGLPLLTFRTVVAHEYAHAWQGENCPLLDDDTFREGFAEWVAYRHLLYLGCTRAAERMRTSDHPYRPFLDAVLTIDAQQGPAGVIQAMLAVGGGVPQR